MQIAQKVVKRYITLLLFVSQKLEYECYNLSMEP